ncbi:hypothetical protein [Devosia sp.]|uniref:hypothetical protein n=1 Tax=Devosia sp. TaxID=1871048 RepID=UPI0026362168|nr:hypothetical protein [Devosia sp.]
MRARSKILVLLCLATALAGPLPALAQPSGGGGPGDGGSSPPASPAGPAAPAASPARPTPAPHETALEAVQSRRALPLGEIVSRNGIVDQLIDAQFVLADGQLVYRFKLLSASGQLRVLYFRADTGAALEGE